ncbi:ATP-binding protein [Nesterenkonia sp.]|uniref:AlbA family DNA-binding domain-containing protein n=1 Tax=Nesterenkonia sp. TaxID=704201 RepID=UPI0026069D0F|nr:ATP-binding protein [Nesterenkonia sp.]
MNFTPLHQALGLSPSPLTDEILSDAVAAGVMETDDLDWKSELPAIKGLSQTDVPKDIAAMANSGGGMIVYGVEEHAKAATGRKDTGEFTEGHERAYRSVAVTATSPPVFGLEVYRLGAECRAVAVVIPASVDGPHLIYRNDFFGAPIRNDADTAWMKERQIEAMYRARFDERRRATEAVDSLFAEAADGRDTGKRAWLVAVAHPRVPGVLTRLSRDEAREVFQDARAITLSYSKNTGVHPLENVEPLNPRPGLRRWVAPNIATGERSIWKEAWASVHHDGSVSLAAAIGGHRKSSDGYFEGWQVEGRGIECAVADFMALVRAAARTTHHDEYDVRVGVEWSGEQALSILTVDGSGYTYDGVSTPLRSFTSVRSTVTAAVSDTNFHRQVHELAEDCVNQGGLTYLQVIEPLPEG